MDANMRGGAGSRLGRRRSRGGVWRRGSAAGTRRRHGEEQQKSEGRRMNGGNEHDFRQGWLTTRCGAHAWDDLRDELGRAEVRSSNPASQPGRAKGLFSYEAGMAQRSKPGYQTSESWVRGDFLGSPGLPNTP